MKHRRTRPRSSLNQEQSSRFAPELATCRLILGIALVALASGCGRGFADAVRDGSIAIIVVDPDGHPESGLITIARMVEADGASLSCAVVTDNNGVVRLESLLPKVARRHPTRIDVLPDVLAPAQPSFSFRPSSAPMTARVEVPAYETLEIELMGGSGEPRAPEGRAHIIACATSDTPSRKSGLGRRDQSFDDTPIVVPRVAVGSHLDVSLQLRGRVTWVEQRVEGPTEVGRIRRVQIDIGRPMWTVRGRAVSAGVALPRGSFIDCQIAMRAASDLHEYRETSARTVSDGEFCYWGADEIPRDAALILEFTGENGEVVAKRELSAASAVASEWNLGVIELGPHYH
jgi:hypothetical protein